MRIFPHESLGVSQLSSAQLGQCRGPDLKNTDWSSGVFMPTNCH